MKSAYELAMERLNKEQPEQTLSDAQKAEIAEINSRYEAKIAERETYLQSQIASATVIGNAEDSFSLKEHLAGEIAEIRADWQRKKDAVWNQK